MARSKRRPTVRRNLVFVGAILLVFGLLAVALNFINLKPTLMLPEKHDPTFGMEKRRAPENAHHALNEAQGLLPDVPDEIADLFWKTDRENDRIERRFDPALGDFLGVAVAAAPGPMVDYLKQCAPAVEKMRAALQQPYYMRPEPVTDLNWSWGYFSYMGTTGLGYGAVLSDDPATARQGLEILLDCVRLARMQYPEEAEDLFASGIEEYAMRVLALAGRKPHLVEHLDWLQAELEKLGPPFADRTALLERYWMKLDNTLTYKSDRFRSIGHAIRNVGVLSESRRRSAFWSKHRDTLRKLPDTPPFRQDPIFRSDPELAAAYNDDVTPVGWHRLLFERAARQDFYFTRTLLTVALRRYQVKNSALPDDLHQLVPDFIDSVPNDPMTGDPFHYLVEGSAIRIYGIGSNLSDDQAAKDDMLLLSME